MNQPVFCNCYMVFLESQCQFDIDRHNTVLHCSPDRPSRAQTSPGKKRFPKTDRSTRHWAIGRNFVCLGRRFLNTDPLLYHKFENIWYFFGQETYIHFVAQETRLVRKLFIFYLFHQKRSKSTKVFLLELAVIINELCYNQAYIFLII
mgnify:CR=1 FL=1